MDCSKQCELCGLRLKNSNQLSKHKRVIHKVSGGRKTNIKCMEEICGRNFLSLCELREHLDTIHNFNTNVNETVRFSSKKDFDDWLINESRSTKTSFCSARGEIETKNCKILKYSCNRSGVYKTKGEGKRQLKTQGSCKVNYHCTAQIILKQYPEYFEATYYSSHYRHDFRLGHVPIPESTKQTVAGKLALGVDPKRILQDLRPAPGQETQRENIIVRKDITNIRNEYHMAAAGLGFTFGHDLQSVEAWVETMKKDVLLYKEQGSQHDILAYDDFMLIIMNDMQQEMVKSFGSDRICVDSTYGVTGYDFELVSLLVIDEFEEGFPVAFCCCSTVNTDTMTVFMSSIKERIGIIHAKVFMSDDTNVFYNAWSTVFGPPDRRLLCAWHVDRAWQGHLNCITDETKKKLVYNALKSALHELDEVTFLKMLTNLLEDLGDDPETEKFGTYLRNYYCNRLETWAYCYRKDARINTNMHIEAFHRVIKYIYLDGKKSKRMDKCISALMQYLDDKKQDRIVKEHKGKVTNKISIAQRRHNSAKDVHVQKVSEEKWLIPSSNTDNVYEVARNISHDCNERCVILCRFCHCCYLAYTCTCPDYMVLNNLCKHIHAAISSEKSSALYTGPLFGSLPEEDNEDLSGNTAPCPSTQSLDFVEQKLISLIGICKSKGTVSSVVYTGLLQHINAVEKLLSMPDNTEEILNFKCPSKEPANKNLIRQKRLTSIRQKKQKKLRLERPSSSESEHARQALLRFPLISYGNDHVYPEIPEIEHSPNCDP